MHPNSRSFARSLAAVGLGAVLVLSPACNKQHLAGDSSSMLVIDALEAASGAEPGGFSTVLDSDVITEGSYRSDPARVTFSLVLKNPVSATGPTSANWVTVSRYRVRFIRNDAGPVPAPFEGAATFTVTDAGGSGSFTLVPATLKPLSPLVDLVGTLAGIQTVAEVTFEGVDGTGKAVSVKGLITVHFADWADPDDGGN